MAVPDPVSLVDPVSLLALLEIFFMVVAEMFLMDLGDVRAL